MSSNLNTIEFEVNGELFLGVSPFQLMPLGPIKITRIPFTSEAYSGRTVLGGDMIDVFDLGAVLNRPMKRTAHHIMVSTTDGPVVFQVSHHERLKGDFSRLVIEPQKNPADLLRKDALGIAIIRDQEYWVVQMDRLADQFQRKVISRKESPAPQEEV